MMGIIMYLKIEAIYQTIVISERSDLDLPHNRFHLSSQKYFLDSNKKKKKNHRSYSIISLLSYGVKRNDQ